MTGEMVGFYNFPKGICPKMNSITRLEFELIYCEATVQQFNHYVTEINPRG